MSNQSDSISVGPATTEFTDMLVTDQPMTNVDPTPDPLLNVPALDKVVPLWVRKPGKPGALSQPEKDAQAMNAENRACVQAVLDQLSEVILLLEEAKRANAELTKQVGTERSRNHSFDSFRAATLVFVYVSGQIGGATGKFPDPNSVKPITGNECRWTVDGVDISCTRNTLRIGGFGPGSMTFQIGTVGLLPEQLAVIKPYFEAAALKSKTLAVPEFALGALTLAIRSRRRAGREDIAYPIDLSGRLYNG